MALHALPGNAESTASGVQTDEGVEVGYCDGFAFEVSANAACEQSGARFGFNVEHDESRGTLSQTGAQRAQQTAMRETRCNGAADQSESIVAELDEWFDAGTVGDSENACGDACDSS